MKNLSRDAIQRMFNGNGSVGGGSGGGSDISMAGYATQIWVDQYYLSKEFFGRIFTIHGAGDTIIQPNDMEGTIANIEAMFGFWTNLYVTALGNGGSISAAVYLSQLADVALSNPTDGQALVYDATAGKWKNGNVTSGTVTQVKVGDTAYNPVAGVVSLPAYPASASFGTAGSDYVPITIGSTTKNVLTGHQSLANCFQYKGEVGSSYVSGTFSNIANGGYLRQLSGYSDALIHFQTGGSASGLDIRFDYTQSGSYPLQYRKCIDSNRFAGGWVNLIDEYVISPSVNSGLATLNNDGLYLNGSNGWIRTYGSCGWYSQDHGGGWYMTDNTWIRSYGGRYVYIDSNLASEHIYAGGGSYNSSYALYVNGVAYASTGVYSAGYVTALSDIRKKDVVEDFVLKVADIAKARLIKFTWKDKHDTDIHAGGIAQEWQKILPESVRETAEGELAMDYGVIAVAASVSLAREVVALQKKVKSLEDRLLRLEKMFAINANDLEE